MVWFAEPKAWNSVQLLRDSDSFLVTRYQSASSIAVHTRYRHREERLCRQKTNIRWQCIRRSCAGAAWTNSGSLLGLLSRGSARDEVGESRSRLVKFGLGIVWTLLRQKSLRYCATDDEGDNEMVVFTGDRLPVSCDSRWLTVQAPATRYDVVFNSRSFI